jgi:pentatricopeptide repeat domain-containing protein 1
MSAYEKGGGLRERAEQAMAEMRAAEM